VSFSAEGYAVTDSFDDGYLVKDRSISRIYIIMGNRKGWIVPSDEFSVMGYDRSGIKTVSSSVLNGVPEVRLVGAKGADRIYCITDLGIKRLILSDAVFGCRRP